MCAWAIVAVATVCKSNEAEGADVHVSATDLIVADPDGVRTGSDRRPISSPASTPRGEQVWTRGASGTGVGQFDYPASLFADGDGRLFVVDRGNARVQALDAATGEPLEAFGGPGRGPASSTSPGTSR